MAGREADIIDEILFNNEIKIPQSCDFTIILGCNPVQAKKRALYATNFYKKCDVKMLIPSGGVKHEIGGASVSEFEIMRKVLVEFGIAEADILEENRARDTVGNMVCSLSRICESVSIFDDVKRIAIVTEPYHLTRSLLLAKTFFPEFVEIYGYTEDVEEQQRLWKTDKKFNACVKNELFYINKIAQKEGTVDNRIKELLNKLGQIGYEL